MKFLLFAVCLGGGYLIDSTFLRGETARGLVAWLIAFVAFVAGKRIVGFGRNWLALRRIGAV